MVAPMSPQDRAVYREETEAGGSASQIAERVSARLGRPVTRSAVIGMAHRNGWALRPPNGAKNDRYRKPVSRKPAKPPAAAFVQGRKPPMDIRIPVSRRVSLMELTPTTCRWPIGSPGDEDFAFCGDWCDPAEPYCDHHRMMSQDTPTARAARRAYYFSHRPGGDA